MTIRKIFRRAALLCVLACLAGCFTSQPADHAGGSSGSEIVGVAKYPDSSKAVTATGIPPLRRTLTKNIAFVPSSPAAGAGIYLYDAAFVPDTGAASAGLTPRTHTDSAGAFRLSNIYAGLYTLEVNDGNGMALSVPAPVPPGDGRRIDLGTIILAPTASLEITVNFSLPGEVLYYVSLVGTRTVVRGTQNGITFRMDGIPTGITYAVNVRIYKPVVKSYTVPGFIFSPGAVLQLPAITGQ